MKTQLFAIAALGVSLCTALPAFSGPFGTNMGDSLEKFPGAKDTGRHLYLVNGLPKLHSSFVSYAVKVTPKTGLCLVMATTREFDNDKFGLLVRREFDYLRGQLDSVYGPSSLYDVLRDGSIWKAESEWVVAVAKNERAYQAAWSGTVGKAIKDDISEVLLTIYAKGFDASWIRLQYKFVNHDTCEAEISKSSAGAL
jgi:hypothetical protein